MPKASEILINKFPHDPTQGQRKLFSMMDALLEKDTSKPMLLLKGYAGTGKTTVISALTQVLPLFNMKYVLLAPTGRAAKVMSSYSKKMAFTIHKRIYKNVSEADGDFSFKRQKNYSKKTVFIIDEASMINQETSYGNKGLLSDLVDYVFADSSNRLILVGDNAQLPPVGQLLSPALEADFLMGSFKMDLQELVLTEVMRQQAESGILWNATKLREGLAQEKPFIYLETKGFPDLFRMTSERLEDGLRYAYDKFGIENSIIICRSNKLSNNYNQYIRQRIHFYESELEAGEILMAVRNNYVHTPEDMAGGFVANGDFLEVTKIVSFEEMYGFRFATLRLKMIDYPIESSFEAKVILDTIYSESPALTQEQNAKLYQQVSLDYADLASKKERREAIKKDPYLNALQVKFAYAMTCHKSQGGQWDAVFIDQGYLKDDDISHEYVRWLYTAITRATQQLFLVNFSANFFVSSTS